MTAAVAAPAPVIVLDGEVVDAARATISVLDRGLLYGDGCFEVLRTWDGVAVDLAAHLDRLLDTAAWLALRGVERAALDAAVARGVAAARAAGPPGDHRIRIVLTRGPGPLAAPPASLGPGRAIVIVEPLPPAPAGLALATVAAPVTGLPGAARGHKTLAYLEHLLARELARAAGADEAVRLDAHGCVAEGATSNVFAVTGGEACTPAIAPGVLPGVVRARVLAVCDALGVPVRVGAVRPAELAAADELFVTSAVRGVVPVTQLDGAGREIGPITRQIATAYERAMRPAR